MIRINELRLPLDHPPAALNVAIAQRLKVPADAIRAVTLFKRSHDARKKDALTFIYTVDVAVDNEAAVLAKCAADTKIGATPDTSYHFVGQAPAD